MHFIFYSDESSGVRNNRGNVLWIIFPQLYSAAKSLNVAL